MPIQASGPAVVAPTPTPFTDDDRVDHDALAENIGRWLETPLTGFVLGTENGEEAFLSEQEKLEIIRTVDQARGGERLLIAGIDNPAVSETLRQAEDSVEAGAELVRVRIPRLPVDVRQYFDQVASRSPVPVIVIHQMAPGMFMRDGGAVGAPAEVVAEVLAMDNVYGYIMSGNVRYEARLRTMAPPDKPFWGSNGVILLAQAAIGADGACLMFGNVAPAQCIEIIRLVRSGDLVSAFKLHHPLIEADWQILSRGAQGIKAALGLQGFRTSGPRVPAMRLPDADVEAIRVAMASGGLV